MFCFFIQYLHFPDFDSSVHSYFHLFLSPSITISLFVSLSCSLSLSLFTALSLSLAISLSLSIYLSLARYFFCSFIRFVSFLSSVHSFLPSLKQRSFQKGFRRNNESASEGKRSVLESALEGQTEHVRAMISSAEMLEKEIRAVISNTKRP